MKRNTKLFWGLLCSTLITGTPFVSMAADKIPAAPSKLGITSGTVPTPSPSPTPATPPGDEGLLSGMTPGSYSIPSGWSLVIKQDFEGSLSGDENHNMTKVSDQKHGGTYSISGTHDGDGSDTSWWLRSNRIGSFSEVYVSWYEYIESQARFNDEFWLLQFMKRDSNDNLSQEVFATWWWSDFNDASSSLFFVSQSADESVGETRRFGGTGYTVPTGAWVQWEVHYRPNSTGNSDGFMRIYKDGTLWQGIEDRSFNYLVDMSNMSINIGGVYTKLTWLLSNGSCSSSFGSGTDSGPRVTSFSSPCYCTNQCPPDGKVPIFKRYFDDIIILKK